MELTLLLLFNIALPLLLLRSECEKQPEQPEKPTESRLVRAEEKEKRRKG